MEDQEVFSWMNFRDEPEPVPDVYLGRPGERWAIEDDRCTRIDSSPVNRGNGLAHVKELDTTTEVRCRICRRFHSEVYRRLHISSPCPPKDSRLVVAELRRAYSREESHD